MKHVLVYTLLGFCVFFAACKKKDSYPSPDILLSAQVNGIPWISTTSFVGLDKGPGLHLVIGGDSSSTHMKLEIGHYAGVGKYYFTDTSNTATYTDNMAGVGVVNHKANLGQIIVTSNTQVADGTTNITGTFQFSVDRVSVDNGAFAVKLNLN